jgi:hypothetical protein
VGTKTHLWKHEGEIIFFDDVYKHTAWNRSEHERVILYIDFVVPQRIVDTFYGATHSYEIEYPWLDENHDDHERKFNEVSTRVCVRSHMCVCVCFVQR